MSGIDFRRGEINRRYRLSGGALKIPRNPVERIVLCAKLKRLKRDAERRRDARSAGSGA